LTPGHGPLPEAAPPGIVRYTRAARWYHLFVYVTTLLLLATGWWLLAGREGQPSPLARALGAPDAFLHTWTGWLLCAGALAGAVAGARAARHFVVESLRARPGDGTWLRAWPRAALSGRFPDHDGAFDPGQRAANVVIALGLVAAAGSGAGLALVHGGDAFVWLLKVHKGATYVLTPVLAGHIIVAAGVLPGYRGVWRAMHLDGRVPKDVARRLWPGWTRRRPGA
jgi:cytochrome b subunit of formate dehydrogenase